MNEEAYKKKYISYYNTIIDTMKIIKDFLYPDKYTITRIDSDLPLDEQISLIQKDLESMAFEREIPKEFMDNLQWYFPGDDIDIDEIDTMIDQYGLPQAKRMKSKLEEKYLPFIKLMSVMDYKDIHIDANYTDDEAWSLILNDYEEVLNIENIIKDVIWSFNDDSKEDIVDNYLQDHYKLDNLEFNRYMNGEKNEHSSIMKNYDEKNAIGANFKLFDKYFGDIFGQDKSIEKIRKTLLRNILFYNAEDVNDRPMQNQGPLATFMFYGPTGTGKTETAKRMASFVYGNPNKMLILDMNSYKDSKVSASAIKGHPEGYVDSNKGTDFTRFLQANDKGIIVLDEFEKASTEVRELFMTMLDEGKFKDALGNTYDLSGYIFVATTNVSKVFENRTKRIGFGTGDEKKEIRDEEERIKEDLRSIFTAPIMNRFNNIIGFDEIKKEDAMRISESLLNKLKNKFESKKFNGVTPSIRFKNIDEISEIILKESNFRKDGVRSMKNVINDLVGSLILEEIVDGKEKILVSANNGEISVVAKKNESQTKRIKTV